MYTAIVNFKIHGSSLLVLHSVYVGG